MKTNMIKSLFFTVATVVTSLAAHAQSMGSMQVNGEPGVYQIFQKVKVIRCETIGSCDNAVFFSLNKPQALVAGKYLVGFENSIYPGLVTVDAGRTTTLNLEKIAIPSRVQGDRVRIYRDMGSLVEQRKIYLTMFMMKRHFYRLDKDNFGDLYLTGSWERDFVQRFSHSYCPSVVARDKKGNRTYLPAESVTACSGWNGAKSPNDLKTLYKFGTDGTFTELLVTFPGTVAPIKHPRYLVSLPMRTTDFVSVFPGAYQIQAEGKGKVAVKVTVGNVSQNGNFSGISLSDDQSFSSLSGTNDCYDASVWQTDERAYCTAKTENEEGCNRDTARSCSAMDISK